MSACWCCWWVWLVIGFVAGAFVMGLAVHYGGWDRTLDGDR